MSNLQDYDAFYCKKNFSMIFIVFDNKSIFAFPLAVLRKNIFGNKKLKVGFTLLLKMRLIGLFYDFVSRSLNSFKY